MKDYFIWYVFDAENAAKTIPEEGSKHSNVRPGDIMPGIITRSFPDGVVNATIFHDGGTNNPLKVFSIKKTYPVFSEHAGRNVYENGCYFPAQEAEKIFEQ